MSRLMSSSRDNAETQPLLGNNHSPSQSLRERCSQACILPSHLCPPSKAAVLIMFWSALVGTVFAVVMDFSVLLEIAGQNFKFNGRRYHLSIFLNVFVPYACLAVVLLLYPLTGFIADVCCGRYKTVISSLGILVFSLGSFTFTCIIAMICIRHKEEIPEHLYMFGKYLVILVLVSAFVLFVIGQSGFQANYIQLGLDQLLETPCKYLGLFVHWAVWAGSISTPLVHIIFASYACYRSDNILYGMFSLVPMLFVLLSVTVAFSCRKKHWFYSEPGQHNPYKTVIKVLHFARKHKYPLSRSAFTYNDNERPTRIDYAKERYGGPFTTAQVEDVKSFFRILLVLLALGPVFILDVPASYFIFAAFTLHTGYGPEFNKQHEHCSARWILLESGTLGQLFLVIVFPIYIWVVYYLLRKRIPKIFTRLFLGGALLLIGVLSMLVTDLIGHMIVNPNDSRIHDYYLGGNTSYCMFKLDVNKDHVKTLQLHWGFHIIPNLLIGFSPMLILATAFEFISAQSPHSMKGLLVGVFFAIKGLFQLSSAILLLPFSLPNTWAEGRFVSDPRAVNCDFGYFMITCGLALIGLILFSVVAKRYQYRERDDPPYNQAIVEEVFARNVRQNTYQVHSPDVNYTDSFPINVHMHQH